MKNVITERVLHDSGIHVALRFSYDEELATVAKSLPDARNCRKLKKHRGPRTNVWAGLICSLLP